MNKGFTRLGLAVTAFFSLLLPAAVVSAGVAQNIQLSSQMVFGLQSVYPNTIFQYQEPSTTTAQFSGNTVVTIPAASTDNVVSVAALFPGFVTPVAIGIQEVSDPAVQLDVGLSAGGPRIKMAESGFMVFRTASGLPTLYIDNADATHDANLRVFGLSN